MTAVNGNILYLTYLLFSQDVYCQSVSTGAPGVAPSPSFGSGESETGPLPTRSIFTRVNNGVETILGGVGSGRLSDILRGSFMFTRNENVRTISNPIIDAIFGRPNENRDREANTAPLSRF